MTAPITAAALAARVAVLGKPSRPVRLGAGDGLHLLAKPSGACSWVLRFTDGGRRRDMGLGPYPAVGLAEARELAAEARGQMRAREVAVEAQQASEPADWDSGQHLPADWDDRLDEVTAALALLSERVERQQAAIGREIARQVLAAAPRPVITMLPGPRPPRPSGWTVVMPA